MALTAHYYTKLEEGNFYHVYNRSVNRKPMFTQKRNYYYFLSKMVKYIFPFVDVYAFCLLGNHFHLLLKVKELHKNVDENLGTLKELPNLELPNIRLPNLDLPNLELPNIRLPNLDLPNLELPNLTLPNLVLPKPVLPSLMVSAAFKKMFQSYALAFNKQERRIGTLFQEPFKRSLIESEEYLYQMIYYIHFNPQKHRLVSDFRTWPYSSYPYYLQRIPGNWVLQDLFDILGGYEGFIEFHNNNHDEPNHRHSIE